MHRILTTALLLVLGLASTVAAQDKFFDSAGVQIRYVEKGSGEPIVLIHGYSSYIERQWVENGVLDNLAKDYRVIALDLRAHGKSGKPHEPAKYGIEVSQDVIRLLDHLRIQRAHIIGYSYGATITAKLLTTNPERFLTAVFGGASGRRSWTAQDARDSEMEASELEHGLPYRTLILRTWPTDEPAPSEEVLRERSREFASRNDPLAHAAMLRARAAEAVTDAQLTQVRVPVLAIVGSADRAITGIQALKKAWPALNVVVIDGASHAGARGAPARPEFVQGIRTFIAAHPPRVASGR